LNFYYCHRFPMKHLLHFNKLSIVYHFMYIQTINVTSIWNVFCNFWLGWVVYVVAIVVILSFYMFPHCD
jgi:hypothetical protein